MLGNVSIFGAESVMIFALGFLVATLFAIAGATMVHARAVRLTRRKLDAVAPISMSQMQAEKDQVRADFAMSTRRLESSIEELRNKTAAHGAELARKSAVIDRLKGALDEKSSNIAALESNERSLEAREQALFEELRTAKADLAARNSALFDARNTIDTLKTEFANYRFMLEQRGRLADMRETEIEALKTEIGMLRQQIAGLARLPARSGDRAENGGRRLEDAYGFPRY